MDTAIDGKSKAYRVPVEVLKVPNITVLEVISESQPFTASILFERQHNCLLRLYRLDE